MDYFSPCCTPRAAGRASSIHMILSKSAIVELDMGELDEILRRVEAKQLQADDYQTIRELIESYVGLTLAVGDKSTTIRRLRQMLFGATTEKTATVVGAALARDEKEAAAADHASASSGVEAGTASVAEGDANAALEPIVGAGAQSDSQTPAPGHGRNGADDYVGAEKINVPHPSLSPGDPCPQCETGTVYETGRPGVVVRLIGQSPVGAKVYYLQKLRCNLCGVVFTAELPEGTGEEKYDATVGSMIALLKYGTGMPFHRAETLQASLGIPLPASTQWDIVAAQAERAEPVFAELVQQAAQGDVVYNDDTTIKILAVMKERARPATVAEEFGGTAAEDCIETLGEDLADHGEQRGASEGDGACIAKKSTAERTGTFTSGIVSTRDGRRIALFFSGRQHAGENLKDVLARRAADRRRADSDVRRPDAQSARQAADDPCQLPGSWAAAVCRCGGAVPRRMPARARIARRGVPQRCPGPRAASIARAATALSSTPQRADHEGASCLACPTARRAPRRAELRAGQGHDVPASALGEADAVPARGGSAAG